MLDLEKGKFGAGGEFPGLQFHTITREILENEIQNQLNEAELFGETGFSLPPKATRAERKARDKSVESAAQPLRDAATAHNEAHEVLNEKVVRANTIVMRQQTASINVFLGGKEGSRSRIEYVLEAAREAEDNARNNVISTNEALPPRLQVSHQ